MTGIQVDESSVLTGCEDGLVREVSFLPNKVLGVIGDHDGFPVEGFEFSSDRRMLASFSHDSVIRLWDASMFVEDDEGCDEHPEDKDDEDGMEVGEEEASDEGSPATTMRAAQRRR